MKERIRHIVAMVFAFVCSLGGVSCSPEAVDGSPDDGRMQVNIGLRVPLNPQTGDGFEEGSTYENYIDVAGGDYVVPYVCDAAERLDQGVGIARGIDDERRCAVGDEVDVVLDGAQHHEPRGDARPVDLVHRPFEHQAAFLLGFPARPAPHAAKLAPRFLKMRKSDCPFFSFRLLAGAFAGQHAARLEHALDRLQL